MVNGWRRMETWPGTHGSYALVWDRAADGVVLAYFHTTGNRPCWVDDEFDEVDAVAWCPLLERPEWLPDNKPDLGDLI
jgi:hypothetical protein